MYDTIVVATDGSAHARRATDHAAYVAATVDATLSLVTVVDPASAAGPFSAGGIDEAYREQLRTTARETVATAADAVDYPTETAVRLGRPAESVLVYAEERGADLIVVGTRGQSGLRRHLLGSVAERLVALADVPVLTARAVDESPVDAYDEVVIATDGSTTAETAADHALALADRVGARVHAVTVVAPGATELDLPETARSELLATAEDAVGWISSRARADGLDAVDAVLDGRPATTVVEYAADHDADLIVLGRTGQSGLSEVLLGSTTDRVLRRADAPVLTVGTDAVLD